MKHVLRAIRMLLYWARAGFRFLLSAFVAGESCLLCGAPSVLLPLCRSCQKMRYDDIKFDFPRCVLCGRYVRYRELKNRLCKDCAQKPILLHTDRVFPLYLYEKTGRAVLSLWKMHGIRSIGDFFAHKCYTVWKKRFFGIPIVPVPPRKGKLFKTGWDQVRDVVWTLRFRYNVPVCELLVRLDNIEQKKQSRQNRIVLSAAGRYAFNDKFRRKMLPHTVVLLDDIMTTGSTIENCAAVLRESGVECVNAMSVFFVP